jgi:hypothetical protein
MVDGRVAVIDGRTGARRWPVADCGMVDDRYTSLLLLANGFW